MSDSERLSRRGFLQAAGALSGSAWLRSTAPLLAGITQAACTARDEGSAYRVLNEDDAADFAAIAARLIPTTDTPGASEAGVIHFIDQAFAADMAGSYEFALAGLAELNADGARFAALGTGEQDDALRQAEGTPFFELMRVMTIFGFFAMPSYGGNADRIAWKLIGFEGHHGAWQYPFGHYDAEIHGGRDDG